ncbi:MAG: CBS domain-containing protein [Planctomycetaceae bacterium]|nr:CBS domain-containing protein [Planctomycetaceae bacterium]
MTLFSGRLATLRVSDVMNPEVVTVSAAAPIEEAIVLLKSHHITGAPVIDDDGRFVGILSLSDLVDLHHPPAAPLPDAPEVSLPNSARIHGADPTAWRLYDLAAPLASTSDSATLKVADRMTRLVVTVPADAALVQAARVMCDGHLHRVPVLDENGGLCGIVATMDILAALVNAADEPD